MRNKLMPDEWGRNAIDHKSYRYVNPWLIPPHDFSSRSYAEHCHSLIALRETPIFRPDILIFLLQLRDFLHNTFRKFFAQYTSTYFSNLTPILTVWSDCGLSGGTRTGCWCTWPSIIFLLRAAWYSLPQIYSHSPLRMIRLAPPTTTTMTVSGHK